MIAEEKGCIETVTARFLVISIHPSIEDELDNLEDSTFHSFR